MNKIKISRTRMTPYIYFNPSRGKLRIRGRSSPENSLDLFGPLIRALECWTNINPNIVVDFKLDYFNSSSTKCLFMIFKRLNELQSRGHTVRVNWHAYEFDEDVIEAGEDFEEMTELKFTYILF